VDDVFGQNRMNQTPPPVMLDQKARLRDACLPAGPYRVLLVDDDAELLAHYRLLLEGAGMQVRTVPEPLVAMAAADGFRPDVMVLDIDMPECTGLELAAILREHERYAQVPIIFLSDESEIKQKLLALELGGDDFLIKPVDPAHLVATVTVRAKRWRYLQQISDDLRFSLSESTLSRIALDHHAIVSIADTSGNIIYANNKFTEISGYSLAELLGHNHRLLKSGVHPAAFYEEMWATISGGTVWQGEICNRRKDGSYYWVESTIVPFLDANGLPYQYISVRTDITALMQAEQELAEREERLRRSQIYANIGTWDWDIQTGALYWSDRIGPLFGYPEGKLDTTYENFINSVHPDDRQMVIDAVSACVSRGETYNIEHRCVWPDGTVHWLLESGDVTRDMAGKPTHMLGVVQDITRRKEAELALQASERQLKDAQRTASLGHWSLDVASGDIEWSDEVYHIYGRDPAVFQPTLASYYAELMHPDDVAAVQREEQAAYASGRRHGIDHRIRWPDGTLRWVHIEGLAESADNGQPLRISGVVQDITDRKRAEAQLVAARDEAERANRAKSDFLSSMSHELRTPMNAILGFAQLLEADGTLTADQQDSVNEMLSAGRHLLELINDVLDLAKVEAGRVDMSIEPVTFAELAGECMNLIRPLAEGHGIALEWDDSARCALRADRVRLKQALLNLLSNAVKYNRPRGRVRLRLGEAGNGRARLLVSDNGPGIAAAKLVELFQPFHRLGAEQSGVEGTGIGLVITRRLIEMMGGSVGVESEPGIGSTFWIELPLDDGPPTDRITSPVTATIPAGMSNDASRTVLYIEDNPANLKLVSQLLARRPHVRLLTAHTPTLGINLAVANRPDLVLLDINMPDMDGYEVLAQLRAHDRLHDLPVVAITANAMPRDIERGMAAGFTRYLTKPLNMTLFLETVDRLLPERSSLGA
jgi:PAS domain S-box-containing protein